MFPVIFISLTSIILMLLMIIFCPKIKIKNIEIQTFWFAPLLGALCLLIFKQINFSKVFEGLTVNDAINPLKILILFISMTFLSIVLDELGFFNFLANWALKKAQKRQILLFIILYVLCSVLTIFTSNDIIILTFTPFIVFFAKRANIDPIPYLVSEFVAANTWSMFLIIGNPTNIYLATKFDITFFAYIKVMFLPTIFGGLSSLFILLLLFKKKLSKQVEIVPDNSSLNNPKLVVIGLICLAMCTILLSISPYIKIEMFLISFIFALLLGLIIFISSIAKKNYDVLIRSFKRLPYTIIPFVISMFVIVLALKQHGVTSELSSFLRNDFPILTYGTTSFLSCNLINNIPMSVFFSEIVNSKSALYSTIIGSNIGAFLTPIGALAGIMWLSILKKHEINYDFKSFVKYGIIISFPTLFASLLGLWIML